MSEAAKVASDKVEAVQSAGTSALSTLEAEVKAAFGAACTKFAAGYAALKLQLGPTAANLEAEAKTYLVTNALPLMQALQASAVSGASKFAIVQAFLLNFYKTDIIPALGSGSVLGWVEGEIEAFAAAQGLSWLGPIIQGVFNLLMAAPAAAPGK
jgi:hypothetical protein